MHDSLMKHTVFVALDDQQGGHADRDDQARMSWISAITSSESSIGLIPVHASNHGSD
jgi:hypothetical protein